MMMRFVATFSLAIFTLFGVSVAQGQENEDSEQQVEELIERVGSFFAKQDRVSFHVHLDFEYKIGTTEFRESPSARVTFQAPNKMVVEPLGDSNINALVSDGVSVFCEHTNSKYYHKSEVPEDRAGFFDYLYEEVNFGGYYFSPEYLTLIQEGWVERLCYELVRIEIEEREGESELRIFENIDFFELDDPVVHTQTVGFDAGELPLPKAIIIEPDFYGKYAADDWNVPAEVVTVRYNFIFSEWKFGDEVEEVVFEYSPPAGFEKSEGSMDGFGMEPLYEPAYDLIGENAPDFDIDYFGDRESEKLSDVLDGETIVILDFWATWCGPCIQVMPGLSEIEQDYKDKKVRIIAVNQMEDEETIRSFYEDQGFSITTAYDPYSSISDEYLVSGIPQTVLIGKTGKVEDVHIGAIQGHEKTLRTQIDQLLEGIDLAAESEKADLEPSVIVEQGSGDGPVKVLWSSQEMWDNSFVYDLTGDVYVVSGRRLTRFDRNGERQGTVSIPRSAAGTIAELDGDSEPEFVFVVSRFNSSKIAAYDHEGALLFDQKVEGDDAPSIFAEDMDCDGFDDIFVAWEDDDPIQVFDHEGKFLWKDPRISAVDTIVAGCFSPFDAPKVVIHSEFDRFEFFKPDGTWEKLSRTYDYDHISAVDADEEGKRDLVGVGTDFGMWGGNPNLVVSKLTDYKRVTEIAKLAMPGQYPSLEFSYVDPTSEYLIFHSFDEGVMLVDLETEKLYQIPLPEAEFYFEISAKRVMAFEEHPTFLLTNQSGIFMIQLDDSESADEETVEAEDELADSTKGEPSNTASPE